MNMVCRVRPAVPSVPRAALAVLTAVVCAAGAGGLEHAAPPLTVEHWAGGAPVDPSAGDGKTVYVVDFWFADCPPCAKSVPILNRIQERFADRNVVVVGVNARVNPTMRDSAERVEQYRADRGLVYRTALDRDTDANPNASATTLAWHSDRESIGYPSAFVVDAEGRIVWRGSPLGGLERVVERVLDGSWTHVQAVQAAAAGAELERGRRNRDAATIHQASKTLAALEPDNPEHFAQWYASHQVAGHPDDLDAVLDGWYRASAGNADSFVALAQQAVASEDFARRRPRLAAGALAEAVKLTRGDPRATLMVALGYFRLGLPDRALSLLDEAVAEAKGDPFFAINCAPLYGVMGRPERSLAVIDAADKPSAEDDPDNIFAQHRAYYEQMAALKRDPDQPYTPTAEPPAAPTFPTTPLALPAAPTGFDANPAPLVH